MEDNENIVANDEHKLNLLGYWDGSKIVDSEGKEVKLADSERQPCEIWTRVMGYHRPVSEFNKGKKEEFYERKCFTEAKAQEGLNERRAND